MTKQNENNYKAIAEAIVGDDAINRYTHEELLDEVYRLKDIEQKFINDKPRYTYIYGDELPEVWTSLDYHIHNKDDRIKLQFVEFQSEGSYE